MSESMFAALRMKQRHPLADRSNSRSESTSSDARNPPSVRGNGRKSTRQKRHPDLDSSENAPSDHSSIYDAPRARSLTHNDDKVFEGDETGGRNTFQENKKTADRSKISKAGVRFVNRPQGTPLFTIAEQRSLATLRSKASKITINFRPKTPTEVQEQEISSNPRRAPSKRILSASADDVLIKTLRRGFGSAGRATQTSSTDAPAVEIHLPLEPPFCAPERVKTPDGLPP